MLYKKPIHYNLLPFLNFTPLVVKYGGVFWSRSPSFSSYLLISALLATYSIMISIQPTVVLNLFLDHCKPNLAICSNLLQEEWSLVEWSHLVCHHWNSSMYALRRIPNYKLLNLFVYTQFRSYNSTANATFTHSVCSTFFLFVSVHCGNTNIRNEWLPIYSTKTFVILKIYVRSYIYQHQYLIPTCVTKIES